MKKQKIAIIGSGISGLSAAYFLRENFDVTIFEERGRLGGHARTIITPDENKIPIDTGFIVFNYANYPHLAKLFQDLNVKVEKSNMSFGASFSNSNYEYALANFSSLFVNNNITNIYHYRMIKDILRFNRYAQKSSLKERETIFELFQRLKLGSEFINRYFLPISGAIWSATPEQMKQTPASFILKFFRNHNLVSITGHHQWYTVSNGSQQYVSKLENELISKKVNLKLNMKNLVINNNSVISDDYCENFDKIILATHSDQALKICKQLSVRQIEGLNLIAYQKNQVILHSDETLMPKNKKCWASWVYLGSDIFHEDRIPLTYWMNNLQNIDSKKQYFVTLNNNSIREDKILDITTLHHPIFNMSSLEGQDILRKSQGENNIYLVGAYMGNGFHEDGIESSYVVTEEIKMKAKID